MKKIIYCNIINIMKIKPLNKTVHFENDGELEFFFIGMGSAF